MASLPLRHKLIDTIIWIGRRDYVVNDHNADESENFENDVMLCLLVY